MLATGGAGGGSLFGDDASIEAFEPPYLFRGVRPRIASLSSTNLVPGGTFTMDVVNTREVTKVVLVGARNSTHWVDGGPQRILPLTFTQTGATTAPLDRFGSAVSGADFSGAPANVVIPAGQTSASFTLTLLDDTLAEGAETVTFALQLNAGFAPAASL